MTEKSAQDQKIYDLTDVYDERSGHGRRSTDKGPQQIIVIDGRGYERVNPGGQSIHDLTEVVDEQSMATIQINDIVMKQATQIIEKVARQVVPEIAERIIKEEIEKIKKIYKEPS
ncbi:MAG TPA: hypothetical protein VKO67_08680 [Smithellaceae bacterium]|nr:hypothetical protein [Smithellaceae bacterium]